MTVYTHDLPALKAKATEMVNVKEQGIRLIEAEGPFTIHGDADIGKPLDELLRAFVAQRRMKLLGEYKPCYRIVA